jgi:hypothetical protein
VLDGPDPARGEGDEAAVASEAGAAGPPRKRRRAATLRLASTRRGSVRISEQYSLPVPAGGTGTRCTLKGP